MTSHESGDRTLRALCEMDDTELLRDVTYSVDRSWHPKDCFIRVRLQERFVGSGWFRFAGTLAECETLTAAEGRLHQAIALEAPPVSFINHAVACDVWHWAGIDLDPGRHQVCRPVPACSPLPNGASGPTLSLWPLPVVFRGRERITTRAGVFDCLRATYLTAGGEPSLDTWCTDDPDRIMVKMEWPPFRSTFELVELSR
ncbi:MAG: DUF3108 domain-containing protein [Alphaproteobacteria bacterium]|nr:DUF3108 domain-containing protein [Alphaproteobacteria bacterium]